MGFKAAITALILLLGVSYGKVDVRITGAWKQNVGWQLTCAWSLSDRPLQSVRLYKDGMQFYIYRPETHGIHDHIGINSANPNDPIMTVDCRDLGSTGACQLTLQLRAAPVFNTTYKCEVSEEGPRFEIQAKDYVVEVFVPPSYPKLEVLAKDSLNNVTCLSTGIPAPRLVWTIADRRIPENFSKRFWDSKSKLWNSWSVVSLSQEWSLILTCEVHYAKGGRAHSAEVAISSANNIGHKVVLLAATLIVLRR